SLTKIGRGTLTLSGANSYTGATTVNAGVLLVNGSIASSSLTTVNSGTLLGGTGIVGNLTINGGTLSPGQSIGTITANGNVTFNAGSTYLVEVSPSAADRTNVSGTATLRGTVPGALAPPRHGPEQDVNGHEAGLNCATFTGRDPRQSADELCRQPELHGDRRDLQSDSGVGCGPRREPQRQSAERRRCDQQLL